MVAVAIGMAVMALGGAPRTFLVVNAGAMIVGLVIAFLLATLPPDWRWPALAAGLALLATAIWGAELNGVHRWVTIGPLRLQPAFILLPLLLCSYARFPDSQLLGVSMVVAAIAVALQPDWAMAFAMTMASICVLAALRNRLTAMVTISALAALAITLVRGDDLPAVRFVETVIVDGLLGGRPVVGALILIAIATVMAPLLLIGRIEMAQQRALVVFLIVWVTLLIASVVAPYPTPLLGYGASAIIGYFMAIVMLRPPARSPARELH